ncbi:hypothetical protein Kim5_PC00267 (plasmid) [Rhizobium sp. Kim5]|nr:hypothetical protein Kim5_PC00267 [Rhizobium sp. Kim5]
MGCSPHPASQITTSAAASSLLFRQTSFGGGCSTRPVNLRLHGTSQSACVLCLASWSIDTDRSTSDKHGFFEIREEARRFISQENAKEQWDLLEPNAKVLVLAADAMDPEKPWSLHPAKS